MFRRFQTINSIYHYWREKDFPKFFNELTAAAALEVTAPNGKTLLQNVAGSGDVRAILWLLYAGAQIDNTDKNPKTPLYLALENKHVIAAQVLYLCGANLSKAKDNANEYDNPSLQKQLKELKPDLDVLLGIGIWGIRNYRATDFKTRLFTLLQPQLTRLRGNTQAPKISPENETKLLATSDDKPDNPDGFNITTLLDGFIEMAASLKLNEVATLLYTINQHHRTEPQHNATLGYWGLKLENETILSLVASDDAHITASMSQLWKIDSAIAITRKAKLTVDQKKLLPQAINNITYHKTEFENVYEQICFNRLDCIDMIRGDESPIDYTQYITHALEMQNYVALNAISEHLATTNKLLETLITINRRTWLIFAMFSQGLSEYDLLLTNPKLLSSLTTLHPSYQESLLYALIDNYAWNYTLKDNASESTKAKALYKYFYEKEKPFEATFASVYFRCILDLQTGNNATFALQHLTESQKTRFILTSNALQIPCQLTSTRSTQSVGEKVLNITPITKMIVSYLTPDETARTSSVCTSLNLFGLNHELRALGITKTNIQQEIQGLSYNAIRSDIIGFSCFIFAFLAFGGGASGLSYGTYYANNQLDALAIAMRNITATRDGELYFYSCLDKYLDGQIGNCNDVALQDLPGECKDDCNKFFDLNGDFALYISFAIVTGLIALAILAGIFYTSRKTINALLALDKSLFLTKSTDLLSDGLRRRIELQFTAMGTDFPNPMPCTITHLIERIDAGEAALRKKIFPENITPPTENAPEAKEINKTPKTPTVATAALPDTTNVASLDEDDNSENEEKKPLINKL